MPDQGGIGRRSPIKTIAPLGPTGSPDQAIAQLRQTHADLVTLQTSLDAAYSALSRRMNAILISGTAAQRPAAGIKDRFYYATDTTTLSYDDGTAWHTISTGGGSGYATVQDEGIAVTVRAILNFIGATVTAADDAPNTRTNVTISAAPLSHTHPESDITGLVADLAGLDNYAGSLLLMGA